MNMKTMISKNAISSFVMLLLFTTTGLFAQKEKKEKDKIMDKKIYNIEYTENDKKNPKAIPDDISFANNKMKQKILADFDFAQPLPYTVTADTSEDKEVTITVEIVATNAKQDELKWTATITGEDIEGSAIITSKKGKVKKDYAFKGTQKVKKKPGAAKE